MEATGCEWVGAAAGWRESCSSAATTSYESILAESIDGWNAFSFSSSSFPSFSSHHLFHSFSHFLWSISCNRFETRLSLFRSQSWFIQISPSRVMICIPFPFPRLLVVPYWCLTWSSPSYPVVQLYSFLRTRDKEIMMIGMTCTRWILRRDWLESLGLRNGDSWQGISRGSRPIPKIGFYFPPTNITHFAPFLRHWTQFFKRMSLFVCAE